MPAVSVTATPTRAQVTALTAEHLEAADTHWTNTAKRWESTFESLHNRTLATTWEGSSADAAADRAWGDVVTARGAAERLYSAASAARYGAGSMMWAKTQLLDTIEEAEAAGFSVGQDFWVTDPMSLLMRETAARRMQQQAFTADIASRVRTLVTIDAEVSTQITAALAPLDDLDFKERGDGEETVRVVDYSIKESPAGIDGKGIEVDDNAINGTQPPLPAPSHTNDPAFGSTQKNALERTLSGTGGRADGEAAVAYLRARGWNTAADVIQHYLANESGDGDPSVGKPLQLSTAQTDALTNDAVNGYRNGLPSLPDLLGTARDEAIQNAARSGQSVYTEVHGTELGQQNAPGWNVVGGSNPDTVYSLGEYSVQVVTQVETASGGPVVHQRYYVYDYTDFAHNNSTITHPEGLRDPFNALKMTTIDELSTLRDIGYARGFNTHGTSTIRTYH